MHPYHHALSSARRFGGAAADYQPLHSWFDASKSTFAHVTHRAFHHHREGVDEARHLFGQEIRTGAGQLVSVEALGLQHLAEDLGIIATAADWLTHLDPGAPALPAISARDLPSADELAAHSARRFNIEAELTRPVHDWFLATARWFDDMRHLAMRHHAFGCFQAEARFGLVLISGARALPTRVLAEWHVRRIMNGRIPAAADLLRHIKAQRWMAAAQNAQRLGLG